MVYDFTVKESAGDIGGLIDTLSVEQERQVFAFIQELKEAEGRKKQQDYINLIMDSIIPLLKDLAETTYSRLEIEQKETAVYVLLKNPKELDMSETKQLRKLRVVLSLADYIGIDKDGEWVRLNLAFGTGEEQ